MIDLDWEPNVRCLATCEEACAEGYAVAMASSIPPLILAPARDTRRKFHRAVPPSQDLLAKASFSPIDTEPSTSPAFFKEAKCAHC